MNIYNIYYIKLEVMKIFFISRIDNVVQSLRFLVGEFFAEGKFAEENFVKSLAC